MNPPEPPLPRDDTPPFAAPWQAQAFALTVALNEAGHFTWTEWTAAFSARLEDAAADAGDYWEIWLETLEALLAARGIASTDLQATLAAAWQRAAAATPHGAPVLLANDPASRG